MASPDLRPPADHASIADLADLADLAVPAARHRHHLRRHRRSATRRAVPIRWALAVATAVTIVGATALPAGATWSIVAVDSDADQVGAAIASCVPADILGDTTAPLVPVVLVPGIGAGVTQGQLDVSAPARIRELLEAGSEPTEIVDELVTDDADPLAPVRQHAVTRLPDQVAATTGADNGAVALDRAGPGVSVQGNLLAGEAVVTDALDRFGTDRADGASLAQALVAALLAGSTAGGDRRCGDQTALFAQVAVADRGDRPDRPSMLLTVTVADGDGQNPVALLAEAYAEGRRGLVDVGDPPPSGTPWFRIGTLVAAVLLLGGGVVAFGRGLGSVRARR